jgi:hypothetical protein
MLGVWTNTTIFIPGKGNVEVPVGGMIIFSGSKAHAGMAYCLYNVLVFKSHTVKGSGYLIGNRRLHFYFFSTNTWQKCSAPVEDLAKYKATMQELECSDINPNKRAALETKLLGLLQVYDIGSDERDAFDSTDESNEL